MNTSISTLIPVPVARVLGLPAIATRKVVIPANVANSLGLGNEDTEMYPFAYEFDSTGEAGYRVEKKPRLNKVKAGDKLPDGTKADKDTWIENKSLPPVPTVSFASGFRSGPLPVHDDCGNTLAETCLIIRPVLEKTGSKIPSLPVDPFADMV